MGVLSARGSPVFPTAGTAGTLAGETNCRQMVREFSGPDNLTDYNYHCQYDAAGNPVARTENGRTTGYGYNELNQHNAATAPDQTDVAGVLARPAGEAVAVSVNGLPATVDRIADPIFSALSSPISAGAEGVAWHRLGLPLTQGENPFVVQASTASGQRVAQTNVVSVAAAPVFGYDGNGNMTTDGRFTYSWNDEDRLVSAVPVALTNGARKVEHVYDWMGRRILRTVSKLENNTWSPDNQTRYVYQDWNVIWETITHAQQPQETNWNFWGLDLSGSVQGAGGVGGLLATQNLTPPVGEGQDEDVAYFAFYDGNGNVMQYTSPQGGLAAGFEYDPFGVVRTFEGGSRKKFHYRFSTKPEDFETTANYYINSFYFPSLGHWINRDILGEQAGINLLAFVDNTPSGAIDYLGMQSVSGALPPGQPDCSIKVFLSHNYNFHMNKIYERNISGCRKTAIVSGKSAELIPGIKENWGWYIANTPLSKEHCGLSAEPNPINPGVAIAPPREEWPDMNGGNGPTRAACLNYLRAILKSARSIGEGICPPVFMLNSKYECNCNSYRLRASGSLPEPFKYDETRYKCCHCKEVKIYMAFGTGVDHTTISPIFSHASWLKMGGPAITDSMVLNCLDKGAGWVGPARILNEEKAR